MTRRVLVVDDDRDVLHAARLALGSAAEVETLQGPGDLSVRVADARYDAVLLDMNFAIGNQSGVEGLGLLGDLCGLDPHLSIVLMTTFGGVSLAVEALKRGASDFVLKPWRNDRLAEAVSGACDKTRAARRAASSFNLEQAEKVEIDRALRHHGRNVSRAAAALGMTRQALYRRMVKHGL